MVYLAGLADLFNMCLDFPEILGEEIEEERVDLRLEFDCSLHIEHDLGLCVGMVVDRHQSSSQDTPAL